MKVVLADDSPLILERVLEMVSRFKLVEISGAYTNGTDTLEGIKTLQPDLAIVDINMPGLNGLEVLQEIRKENKEIKFIILTFYATDLYRKKAMELGADFFFSKVDDFEKVPMVIGEMLKKKLTPQL
ncbi:MAG: response regulator transcription factor [Bacteroidota bacterium]